MVKDDAKKCLLNPACNNIMIYEQDQGNQSNVANIGFELQTKARHQLSEISFVIP